MDDRSKDQIDPEGSSQINPTKQPQSYYEPTYDIENNGPNRRFTTRT